MKVGDLVRCTWQPRASGVDDDGHVIPVSYTIKGEFGIIVWQALEKDLHTVLFPKFGYEHTFSSGAFEVIHGKF